ncbi:MAG: EamA family transporter [Candidatus Absconditicoccaceae bacterium]
MRIVYSIIVAITRGILYALLDKLLLTMPIVILCFASSVFNSIFFAIIFWFGKYNVGFKKYFEQGNNLTLFIIVTVLFLVANALILVAIKSKNATVASLIEISYPIFVVLFSYIFWKNIHLNFWTIIGGVMILGGIVLVYLFNK